jgi:hypothetical protein
MISAVNPAPPDHHGVTFDPVHFLVYVSMVKEHWAGPDDDTLYELTEQMGDLELKQVNFAVFVASAFENNQIPSEGAPLLLAAFLFNVNSKDVLNYSAAHAALIYVVLAHMFWKQETCGHRQLRELRELATYGRA